MPRLRRWAHVSLALVLSLFAVAPHEHDGLREALSRDVVEAVGSCNERVAHHLHAAKTTHAQPCVACARQHAGGAFRSIASTVVRPIVVLTIVADATPVDVRSLVVPHLRGPPV